jgi:hypothetical protein
MRTLLLSLAVLIGLPAVARAQASVSFQLNLPVVLPQLVVVSPGVQVVPDVDEEVFLVDGYYWVRRDGGWYRSRSHRHGWVFVPARRVPARIAGFPPGKYKRWKPAHHRHHDDGHRRHDGDGHRGRGHDDHGHRGGGHDDHGHRGRGHDDHDRGHGKHDKHGRR